MVAWGKWRGRKGGFFHFYLQTGICLFDSEDLSAESDSLRPHELYTAQRILQARMLEWVVFSFSREELLNPGMEPRSPAMPVDSLPAQPPGKSESEVAQSCPTVCDPMDPPSMEFSRQEYQSVLPFPSPGNLPNPGIEPGSASIASRRSYRLSHQEAHVCLHIT